MVCECVYTEFDAYQFSSFESVVFNFLFSSSGLMSILVLVVQYFLNYYSDRVVYMIIII